MSRRGLIFATLALCLSATALSACCFGGGLSSAPSAPSTAVEPPLDTSVLEQAHAHGWWLVSGATFFALGTPIVGHTLPGRDGSRDPMRTRHFGAFDLSRDGQLVVAESEGVTPGATHLVVFDASLDIVYEDPRLVAHQLYADYRWSPDGRAIAYAHGNTLLLLDWETKQTRTVSTQHVTVVRDGPPYGPPSWSADSRQLVYQSNTQQIVLLDIESGAERVVGAGRQPQWSPDGRVIVYLHGTAMGANEVRAYDVASSATHTLFACRFHSELVFTPDSRGLLFREVASQSTRAPLLAWSFETQRLVSTGQSLTSMRDARVTTLPDAWQRALTAP